MKEILTLLIAVVALTSCYKAKLNTTDHPSKNELTISVEVPIDRDGDALTGDKTIVFEGVEYVVPFGSSFTIPYLLDAGTYTYYVYSNPTSGESVTWDADTNSIIATVALLDDSTLNPHPEDILFDTETIEILSDSSTTSWSDTVNLIRKLNFELELTGDAINRLSGFSASLNGVAQHWECINNEPYGDGVTVLPTLTKESGSLAATLSRATTSGHTLQGTIYLLGVVSDERQNLTIELSYEGESGILNPSTHTYESDVTDLFSDFNNSSTMTITNIVETPTESNLNGTINDWSVVKESVEAK